VILDICWHDFVRNDAVRRMTQQPPLSSIVKSRWLSRHSNEWGGWRQSNSVCTAAG